MSQTKTVKVLTYYVERNKKNKNNQYFWKAVSGNGYIVSDANQLNTRGACLKAIAAMVYARHPSTWKVIDLTGEEKLDVTQTVINMNMKAESAIKTAPKMSTKK